MTTPVQFPAQLLSVLCWSNVFQKQCCFHTGYGSMFNAVAQALVAYTGYSLTIVSSPKATPHESAPTTTPLADIATKLHNIIGMGLFKISLCEAGRALGPDRTTRPAPPEPSHVATTYARPEPSVCRFVLKLALFEWQQQGKSDPGVYVYCAIRHLNLWWLRNITPFLCGFIVSTNRKALVRLFLSTVGPLIIEFR